MKGLDALREPVRLEVRGRRGILIGYVTLPPDVFRAALGAGVLRLARMRDTRWHGLGLRPVLDEASLDPSFPVVELALRLFQESPSVGENGTYRRGTVDWALCCDSPEQLLDVHSVQLELI